VAEIPAVEHAGGFVGRHVNRQPTDAVFLGELGGSESNIFVKTCLPVGRFIFTG